MNLLKFVQQLLEVEKKEQLPSCSVKRSQLRTGHQTKIQTRPHFNGPQSYCQSGIFPLVLFEAFWLLPVCLKYSYLLSSNLMCSDMIGCLKLTGTNYLKFADTFNSKSKQCKKSHPPFCWVIWIHHGPTFCRSTSSFFFCGAGTIPVVTTKQPLLKPQEIQVVAGLDSVGLGRKRNHIVSKGLTNWDDQNPFSTIFWSVVHSSSSFLIDASRPSSLGKWVHLTCGFCGGFAVVCRWQLVQGA